MYPLLTPPEEIFIMLLAPRRLLLGLAIVFAVGIWLGPETLRASHSWGNYHWFHTANPVSLHLDDNVTSLWDGHLVTALDDWDDGALETSYDDVLSLSLQTGSANPKTCKAVAGRIEVCNAAYGYNGWLGVAKIWLDGSSHIAQATTQLNDSYFGLAQYNNAATRQFVVCQEVGHTFGLDHQDEGFDNPNLGSCMDYTSDPDGSATNPSNEHPNEHDFEQLDQIYTHLDTSSGGGSGGPPGRGRGGAAGAPSVIPEVPGLTPDSSPAEWGALVRANRYTAVFELDLGGGHRVITFVIWAF
jgi:hypothetical protein